MPELPKYTRWEHERKFLVPPELPRPWAATPGWDVVDRYLDAGRLRLRSILDTATGERTFKLCKKFPSASPFSQPIVNIYLSQEEHEALRALPARELRKRRHHDRIGDHTFAIDVFGGELEGLVLCEVEAPSLEDLLAIVPPPYARSEVTSDPWFTGGSLCRTTASELAERLRR